MLSGRASDLGETAGAQHTGEETVLFSNRPRPSYANVVSMFRELSWSNPLKS
jgi:hypothetical protein